MTRILQQICQPLGVFFIVLLGASESFARNDLESEVRKVRGAVETCLKDQRDNCVIENATKILSSSLLSDHILKSDPLALEWYVKVFSKATYRAADSGRAIFKRFMVENGIWTLEVHS